MTPMEEYLQFLSLQGAQPESSSYAQGKQLAETLGGNTPQYTGASSYEPLEQFLKQQFGNIGGVTEFIPSEDANAGFYEAAAPHLRYNPSMGFGGVTDRNNPIGISSVTPTGFAEATRVNEYGADEPTAGAPTGYSAALTTPYYRDKTRGRYVAQYDDKGQMVGEPVFQEVPNQETSFDRFLEDYGLLLPLAMVAPYAIPELIAAAGAGAGAVGAAGATGMTAAEAAVAALASAPEFAAAGTLGSAGAGTLGAAGVTGMTAAEAAAAALAGAPEFAAAGTLGTTAEAAAAAAAAAGGSTLPAGAEKFLTNAATRTLMSGLGTLAGAGLGAAAADNKGVTPMGLQSLEGARTRAPLVQTGVRGTKGQGTVDYFTRPYEKANEEAVNRAYLDLFGRNAEPAGLEFFSKGLDTGQITQQNLLENIRGGAQNTDIDRLRMIGDRNAAPAPAPAPTDGMSDAQVIVYGPDGRMYSSPSQAIAAGVTNYTMTPPNGEVRTLAAGGPINQGLGYLRSSEDGMADRINAVIDNRQPAKLSGGEFVIPADVVSHLGNGNSDAGAKQLHEFMSRIRKARTGTPKQGRKINPNKFMPK